MPKGSISYRALRRLLGTIGLVKAWEYLSSYYLWNAFPLSGKSQRLFQVVGVPRSGTTLLSSLLDAHSEIICLSEPFHQWKFDGFVYTEEIYDIIGYTVWKKHPALLLRNLVQKSEKRWVGFKETYYSKSHGHWSNHHFFKRNHLQGVLTIAIIRDPREVWKSLILRHPEKQRKVPERFIESWNDLVQWIFQSNVFYVKYEDLIDDPVDTLTKICNHLDLEFEDIMLCIKSRKARGDFNALKGGGIHKNKSRNEYQNFLSKNEILSIESKCGHLMQFLSYV